MLSAAKPVWAAMLIRTATVRDNDSDNSAQVGKQPVARNGHDHSTSMRGRSTRAEHRVGAVGNDGDACAGMGGQAVVDGALGPLGGVA